MSLTAAELLSVLRGTASAELQARFLAEESNPDGEVRRMLRAAESWAHTQLNPQSPSPHTPLLAIKPATAVATLKKAAFSDEDEDDQVSPPVGVKELVEYLRGTASVETTAQLQAALNDSSSELAMLLRQLENEGR